VNTVWHHAPVGCSAHARMPESRVWSPCHRCPPLTECAALCKVHKSLSPQCRPSCHAMPHTTQPVHRAQQQAALGPDSSECQLLCTTLNSYGQNIQYVAQYKHKHRIMIQPTLEAPTRSLVSAKPPKVNHLDTWTVPKHQLLF
jgi:DNA-binding transcriptional MocR family regulator